MSSRLARPYAALPFVIAARMILPLGLLLGLACGPTPTARDASPIVVSEDPVQEAVEQPEVLTLKRGRTEYRLTPKARYTLRSLVIIT